MCRKYVYTFSTLSVTSKNHLLQYGFSENLINGFMLKCWVVLEYCIFLNGNITKIMPIKYMIEILRVLSGYFKNAITGMFIESYSQERFSYKYVLLYDLVPYFCVRCLSYVLLLQ
jgi:hypothetical protein